MKKRLKIWALNWVCRHLLKAVVVSDVITFQPDTSTVYLNREELTDIEKRVLREEAHQFRQTRLYSILINTLAWHAQKVIFEKQKSFDDVWSGKMILYCTDVQKKIVDRLSTL